ncbi:chaplin [Streptomyces griseoluteus]|uniref:Chaplin n=1 Tax=Streptomyces griseoluteus TaxID=29306 RepID=A0A4Z1D0X8_STRGP|nr:chaplin [Streptomyces griseoluteus]TGN75084.1 chaplin [Streptomyces griseoluteus]
MIGVAAASGAMAMAMPVSAAFAAGGATADGAAVGSPGVLSGNTVQAPVSVPLNACGNSVDVVGLLNPAFGNSCANTGSDSGGAVSNGGSGSNAGGSSTGGSQTGNVGGGGATAHSVTQGSPGVLSGNDIQVPVDIPVNACGNSVDVVGALNPAFGNHCGNHSEAPTAPPMAPPKHQPPAPPKHQPPAPPKYQPPAPPNHRPPAPPKTVVPPTHETPPSLAHTGADFAAPALAGSAAFLVAGAALYRRHRPGSMV